MFILTQFPFLLIQKIISSCIFLILSSKSLDSAVFALSNVRNLLQNNIKHTIYNYFFRSFVKYVIAAWGRNKSPEMKKIACFKNVHAVRIIDKAKTASHTDPLFFKYKILKLNDLTYYFSSHIYM